MVNITCALLSSIARLKLLLKGYLVDGTGDIQKACQYCTCVFLAKIILLCLILSISQTGTHVPNCKVYCPLSNIIKLSIILAYLACFLHHLRVYMPLSGNSHFPDVRVTWN